MWVENQREVRSSVACPRQVLGWVWEGWGREQRMDDLRKDMDRKVAQHPKSGSLPGHPTSQATPAPGHCACLRPVLRSPLLRKRLPGNLQGQPWDTVYYTDPTSVWSCVRTRRRPLGLTDLLAPCAPRLGPPRRPCKDRQPPCHAPLSCPVRVRSDAAFSKAFAFVNRA